MNSTVPRDRRAEWFVPAFGPLWFRIAAGLLFLPYTGMVLSFTVIGGMLAPRILWARVVAIAVIYFFGLGIAAHALDAIGNGGHRPWGTYFSKRQLWTIALVALAIAYTIGLYYILRFTPYLGIIALLEGFFVFAYNREWFGGRFHTHGWFAFSWGALPVLSGLIIQTNQLSISGAMMSLAMAGLSLVEINASRPYKALKRAALLNPQEQCYKTYLEIILKSISFGVICLSMAMVGFRLSLEME